ncbi:olfactory receptor 52N2-like [Rhinophrynus dorsalis]
METLNPNKTFSFSHTEFILFGFPGISKSRRLLAIPFFIIYIVILTVNIIIIYKIWVEKSLQFPMYYLISLLFNVNISCATTIVPNTLMGFLFGLNHISLWGCLCQMFFIYTTVMFESCVLLIMALDRYVAICKPLRYHDIMSRRLLLQLSIASIVKSCLFISPIIIVASQVQFCASNTILDFACENVPLLNLGCGDISRNHIAGLVVRILVTAMVICLLFISYMRIIYIAMKIVTVKSRHKTLHTCSTHLFVVVLNYSCGLFYSFSYRMTLSADLQNLYSAIYYLFPSTVHPVIYGFRMTKITICVIQLLRRK